jgi:pyruvate-formate lyase-activating enzyme
LNLAKSLEAAIDPNNRLTFLLDWELTMKCNLDCSYCETGIYGGHDNSIQHPPLAECLQTIDFMFAYADAYMSTKVAGIKYVVLNVYGGEALHHPSIVQILQVLRQRHEPYKHRWHLTVTTTTNAVVAPHRLDAIIPLIDEFTVSYHTDNTGRQKQQFRDNLLRIQAAGKKQKCIVLMHSEPDRFADAQDMIVWLRVNNINHLPRQLDHPASKDFNYNQQQVVWFEGLYQKKLDHAVIKDNKADLADTGRACCGGRSLCADQNYRDRQRFVSNKFPGWYCSVNHFFLYVKQVNGEVYVNKDCKMNFDGTVGPIGNLSDTQAILSQIYNNQKQVIQCAKSRCYCGLCAPKAQDLDTYNTIMRKYEIPNSNLLPQS